MRIVAASPAIHALLPSQAVGRDLPGARDNKPQTPPRENQAGADDNALMQGELLPAYRDPARVSALNATTGDDLPVTNRNRQNQATQALLARTYTTRTDSETHFLDIYV